MSPSMGLLMVTAALVTMWSVSWSMMVMTGATITGMGDCSVNTWPGPHSVMGGASTKRTTSMLAMMVLLLCRPSYTWKVMLRTPGVGSIALFT